MNNQDIIDHFRSKKIYPYYVFVPEAEFLKFTGFKLLKDFDFFRDDCSYIVCLGTVEDKPFWYINSNGVWYDEFSFLDEMTPE